MADVYALSFRDVRLPRSGGVTSAALYRLRNVGPTFDWASPTLGQHLQAATVQWVPWDQTLFMFKDRRVLFVVHGFDVARDSGFSQTSALAYELAGLGTMLGPRGSLAGYDLIVPVLWPGDAEGGYLVRKAAYPRQLGDARPAGRHFADFLRSSATRAARVSFLTHSLGARVALETLKALLADGSRPGIPAIDTLLLTAAAADREVFDDPQYRAAVAAVNRFVVLSSTEDEALGGVYRAGDAIEALLFSGERASSAMGGEGPLVRDPAIRARTEWWPIPSSQKHKHEDYLPNPPEDWSEKSRARRQVLQSRS